MTAAEQTEQFQSELAKFLERERMEYDLTLADMIAVLGLAQFELAQEMQTLNELETNEQEESDDELTSG